MENTIQEHRIVDDVSIFIETKTWKEYCNFCKKEHYVILKPCPNCGVYHTPQPKSEKVLENCMASYMCDGCEAYQDHY